MEESQTGLEGHEGELMILGVFIKDSMLRCSHIRNIL